MVSGVQSHVLGKLTQALFDFVQDFRHRGHVVDVGGLHVYIDDDIVALETAIEENQAAQLAAGSDFVKLQELQQQLTDLEAQLEYKEERWMYLTELKEKIDAGSSR